jgi:hypothetical protein
MCVILIFRITTEYLKLINGVCRSKYNDRTYCKKPSESTASAIVFIPHELRALDCLPTFCFWLRSCKQKTEIQNKK